jgi:hypothetical protein
MDYNESNGNGKETKKIIIIDETTEKNNKKNKQITYEKEKKMRVETKSWGLNDDELSHITQINTIKSILDNSAEKNKYKSFIITHIKQKINGYKHQDILKKKLDESKFIQFDDVIQLLNNCEMKCHYCSQEIYILYEIVREMKQWSLDRINNDIGHNVGNLVVACLDCNLHRRRTNKDAFMFTKNLVITREGI